MLKLFYYIIFFLIIDCSARHWNQSIGYKMFNQLRTENWIALVDDPIMVSPAAGSLFPDEEIQPIFKENIKKAIYASLYNSGKFKEIHWKSDSNYVETSPSDTIHIQIHLYSKEIMRVGYFTHIPLLTFLYFPQKSKKHKEERLFWPTFIPGFWPYIGYFPLLAKSGTMRSGIQCKLFRDKKEIGSIFVQAEEDYQLLFYGVYRTSEPENKGALALERALEELSLQLKDFDNNFTK